MLKHVLQNGYYWAIVFALLFLLTQEHLYLHWSPELPMLGLPNWLYWLMGVHVLLVCFFYVFTKKYWKE